MHGDSETYKVIKTHSTKMTKLHIQYESTLNSLTIVIDLLLLVLLTNRKTERKDVNKLIRRPLLIFY